MIAIQGFKKSKDSIFIILDERGIDEMIDYLNFIKNESSMHLNEGNELSSNMDDIDDDMYLVPHVKIVNVDHFEKP
jgi:hypothetical protein